MVQWVLVDLQNYRLKCHDSFYRFDIQYRYFVGMFRCMSRLHSDCWGSRILWFPLLVATLHWKDLCFCVLQGLVIVLLCCRDHCCFSHFLKPRPVECQDLKGSTQESPPVC